MGDERPEDAYWEQHGQTLAAYLDQHGWVRRRSEHVEFVDAKSLCRTTRIEILSQSLGPVSFLPLGLHDRDQTADRSVRDESGASLQIATSEEERHVVACGLAYLSWLADCEESAARVQALDLERRREIIELVRETLESLAGAGKLSEDEPEGALTAEQFGLVRDSIAGGFAESILESVRPFAQRRLVLCEAPEKIAAEMTIVESHYGPMTFPSDLISRLMRTAISGIRAMELEFKLGGARTALRSVPEANGLGSMPWNWKRHVDDAAVSVPAVEPIGARSFHLQIEAPEGCFVSAAQLVVTRYDDHRRPDITIADDDDMRLTSARFYVPFIRELRDHSVLEATAAIVLRPLYGGQLRPAMAVSVLTTAILVAVGILHVFPAVGSPDLLTKANDRAESLVAILLLVPSLFLASLVRQVEHPIAKAVLWPLRLRLSVMLVLSVAAAVLVAVGKFNTFTTGGYWALLVVATVVTGITCASAERSRAGTRFPPHIE